MNATGLASTSGIASAASTDISWREHVDSADRILSLMRHSGSRTLHFAYWPQFSSSVEQAVTVWEPPWDKDRMSDAAKLQLGLW